MKLKKRFIIIPLIVIVICITGFIFNKKEEIFSVGNKEYKESNIIEFVDGKSLSNLDEIKKVAVFDTTITRKGVNYRLQIVPKEKTNVGWDVYLVNGVAWSVDAFVYEYYDANKNISVCDDIKQLTQSYDSMSYSYNASMCVNDNVTEIEWRPENPGDKNIILDKNIIPNLYSYEEVNVEYKSNNEAIYELVVEGQNGAVDTYFQIVDKESSGLDWDAYLINGDAWPADHFINYYKDLTGNTNICKDLGAMAIGNESVKYTYNNSVCTKELGYKEVDVDYKFLEGSPGLLFQDVVGERWFQILGKDYTNVGWDLYMVDGVAWSVDAFIIEYNKVTGTNGSQICKFLHDKAVETNEESLIYSFNNSICVNKKDNVEYRGTYGQYGPMPGGWQPIRKDYSCSVGLYETSLYPAYEVDGHDQPLWYYLQTTVLEEPDVSKKTACCSKVKDYITSFDGIIRYKEACESYVPYRSYNESNVCEGPYTNTIEGKKVKYYYLFGRMILDNCSSWGCKSEYDPAKNDWKNCIYESDGDLYVRGCSAGADQYFNECSQPNSLRENEIELKCDSNFKSAIINSNDTQKIDAYNRVCGATEGQIETSTITIDLQNGWGPSTLGNYRWSNEWPIYNTTGVKGTTTYIAFDKELINMNYTLIGWSTDPACGEGNVITSFATDSTMKNFEFKFLDNDVTYYACYSGDIYKDSLFYANGEKKTGTEHYVYESDSCTEEEEIHDNVTTVPMKLMSRYSKMSYETVKTAEALGGAENEYCNVLCTDTIDVYYPNIFETVPAGQYFELMYEPEITATRTCQTEFRYNDWKIAYNAAITNEKNALDELSQAQAKYDAANDLSAESQGDCGCCCSGEGCTCTGSCKTYYSDTQRGYYYNTSSSSATSVTASASGCGSSSFNSNKTSTVNSARSSLESSKEAYEKAVQTRVNLERFNYECYTILDSDISNNVDVAFENIFDDNYDIIDSSYTYKTDTEKIILDDDVYATDDDYIDSIIYDSTNETDPSTSIDFTEDNLKYISGDDEYIPNSRQLSTEDFYIINPQIDFIYNNGDSISPKDIPETLKIEAHVKQDTGSRTSLSEYVKDDSQENFSNSFYLEESKNRTSYDTENSAPTYSNLSEEEYISFDAYTATKTYRTVKYYFTFHEATEYFSELQSGDISKYKYTKKNISLSNLIEYQNSKNDEQELYIKNNVYPVSLNALAGKYDTSFKLSEASNKFDEYIYKGFTGNYTCQYEITNDALTLSGDKETYLDLKSNTIFRSIATKNLDPNNRDSTGKLGDNWTDAKGAAVRAEIEAQEEDNEKNTYNPDNLEYSFTLTPKLIQAIQNYNDNATEGYDDFNLDCTEDGRECTSEFLTNLSNGVVNGYGINEVQDNYFNINSYGEYELNQRRKKWKYFDGAYDANNKVVGTINEYNRGDITLENYIKRYEMWGVLP